MSDIDAALQQARTMLAEGCSIEIDFQTARRLLSTPGVIIIDDPYEPIKDMATKLQADMGGLQDALKKATSAMTGFGWAVSSSYWRRWEKPNAYYSMRIQRSKERRGLRRFHKKRKRKR